MVLLPAPVTPSSPTVSPSPMLNETSSTARNAPKSLIRCSRRSNIVQYRCDDLLGRLDAAGLIGYFFCVNKLKAKCPMLVLCNGMPRSASTWSFNVAVELLRRVTDQPVHGGYDENTARFLKSSPRSVAHLVLKSHLIDPVAQSLAQVGAANVIYTWRDVADAVVSFMRMFEVDFGRAYAVMAESLDLYQRYRTDGRTLILSYEEVTADHLRSVRKVAEFLRLPASDSIISAVDQLTALEHVRRKVQEV